MPLDIKVLVKKILEDLDDNDIDPKLRPTKLN